MVDKLANGLAISEILADNATSAATDTDGDGTANKADEYVEIQNTSGSTVSLDGIEIWSQQNGLLYSFGAGATVNPGDVAVVVGEYTGTPPDGFYDAGNSESVNFLQDGEGNKFDTIFLVDTNTSPPTYVTLSYGIPPRAPELPSGFPSGAVQIGDGETINSSSPNALSIERDATGQFVEGTPDPGVPNIVCLAAGVRLMTDAGAVRIEDLRPDDRVMGIDGSAHVLRAVGRNRIGPATLHRLPELAPVVLPAGLVGNRDDLRLSPNHRVLIRGPSSEMMFSGPVLVAAKFLLAPAGARRDTAAFGVDYYHLLFDRHVVLDAEGAGVESLFLGDVGSEWVGAQRDGGTLLEADPEATDGIRHLGLAAQSLRAFEARALIASLLPGPPDDTRRTIPAGAEPAPH